MTNSSWRFQKGLSEGSSPDPAEWRQRDFDDSTWALGRAPFFYSTAPVEPPFFSGGTFNGTTLNDMMNGYSCVFLRIPFTIGSPASVGQLNLEVGSDDGFIAWINGVEVARQNMPAGSVAFNGTAVVSPVEPIPLMTHLVSNTEGLLFPGTNVLAVQAFNRSLDSSDFGFMAALISSVDESPPAVNSLNPPAGATVRSLTQITVLFNEPVTNLTAGDLIINGTPAATVSTNGAREFVFQFPNQPLGVVTVDWAAGHMITDFSGNAFPGTGWSLTLDTNLPPTTLVITEFMASNGGSLRDEDGETSDWIEIYNPGLVAAALDGWFLTDNEVQLTKWRFPAVELAPNGYLLVFASGKDRAIPGGRLHTNFRLEEEGEYLALVRPDGTVASEFAPLLGGLRRDVSYGLAREIVASALVPAGASARVLVPVNGANGLLWTGGTPFDDSTNAGWIATTTGIGFDQGVPGVGSATPLGYWSFDDNSNPTLARDESGHQHHGTISGATFTVDGGGRSGRPGDRAMNFGRANNGSFINVTDANTGWFDSATARNEVTFALWIFGDESEPGINSAFYVSQNSNGSGVRVANAHLPWEDSVIYWDTGGYSASQRVSIFEPDSTKWKGRWNHYAFVKQGSSKQIWQNGAKILDALNTDPLQPGRGFFIGAGPNLGLWTYGGMIDDFAVWDLALAPAQIQALATGSTPLALDTYASLLGGDLGPAMRNQNASALVRMSFVIGALDFDTVLLRIRYDDGFVCWLNGIEVARRNTPAALAWNSTATLKRTKNEARMVEELNLTAFLGSLRLGTNVLAFQALNSSASDTELLLLPELLAGRSNTRVYFTNATPGTANGTGVAGFVADTSFSTDRGLYFAPTNVLITSPTPGAFIVYTRDGSLPTPSNGQRVNAASPNLAPTANVAIATTTLLRAAAFKEGWQATDVDTQSYLFPAHVAAQTKPGWLPASWPDGPMDFAMDPRVVNNPRPGYSLTNALLSIPSISIVAPSNDLFGASGIYANSLATGPAWERRASAELIYPDGRPGFHISCGVRIHGGSSRYKSFTPKHSFSLLFRRIYGSSQLEFPVFFPTSSVEEFDQLVLRGCSTDSWPVQDGLSLNGEPWPRWTRDEASYMRDQWMRDAQLDLGHPSAHGTYVHLYLDGLYWGLYNLAERPDDSFAEAYFAGQREEYDVISDVSDLHSGTWTAWNEMFALASAGLATDAAIQRIQGNNPDGSRNPAFPVYLQLTNLIDYMILHIACGADDWPDHNWWASRRQGPQSEGFRFFSWDQELTSNSLERQRTSHSPFPLFAEARTFNSPAFLYSQMRANFEFRVLFGDRVHRHLFNNGQLSVATNIARWQALHDEVDHAMVAESARWGDYRRPSSPYRREVEWVSNQTWMVTTYFPSNLSNALNRFRTAGLYPQVGAPEFSQFGGDVPAAFQLTVTHTNGSGAIVYFTLDGSDPRRPGGAVSAAASIYTAPIPLASPTLVKARVLKNAVWSALTEAQFYPPQDLTRLQLSEIMYNPPRFGTNDGDELEFIELKNVGPVPLDLTGVLFTDGIQFGFASGTSIGPGQFKVLARNAALYAARYPGAPLDGLYGGRLDNAGETITLGTALGATIFSVTYDDAAPWPAEADNSGLSLQRMNFAVPVTNSTTWIAAPPTPGASLPFEWMDNDGDGMPNGWEMAYALDPESNDAGVDEDQDGFSNRQEFLAGTDPTDPVDRLRMASIQFAPTGFGYQVVLGFSALSNKTYSVIWKNPVEATNWHSFVDVEAAPTNRFLFVTNFATIESTSRFYRLTTPRAP